MDDEKDDGFASKAAQRSYVSGIVAHYGLMESWD